jgi:hypothetical protein
MSGVMCCKSNFKSVLHNRGHKRPQAILQCFEDHNHMMGTHDVRYQTVKKNLGTTLARLHAELKLVINPDYINIYIIRSVLVFR